MAAIEHSRNTRIEVEVSQHSSIKLYETYIVQQQHVVEAKDMVYSMDTLLVIYITPPKRTYLIYTENVKANLYVHE